jgi:hypothetical protein
MVLSLDLLQAVAHELQEVPIGGKHGPVEGAMVASTRSMAVSVSTNSAVRFFSAVMSRQVQNSQLPGMCC